MYISYVRFFTLISVVPAVFFFQMAVRTDHCFSFLLKKSLNIAPMGPSWEALGSLLGRLMGLLGHLNAYVFGRLDLELEIEILQVINLGKVSFRLQPETVTNGKVT